MISKLKIKKHQSYLPSLRLSHDKHTCHSPHQPSCCSRPGIRGMQQKTGAHATVCGFSVAQMRDWGRTCWTLIPRASPPWCSLAIFRWTGLHDSFTSRPWPAISNSQNSSFLHPYFSCCFWIPSRRSHFHALCISHTDFLLGPLCHSALKSDMLNPHFRNVCHSLKRLTAHNT